MAGTQHRPVLALTLLFTIGALMGLTSILVKLAGNAGWQPMAYLLWGLLGGGLLLLLFAWWRGERPGMSLAQQRYYLASGLLSIAVPNGLLFSSIGHVGAGFASMCLAFPPLFTYLLALALRMEALSRIRLLGICIGLSGSLLLALGKLHGGDSPALWVVAALCVPVFLALGNIYRARYWPSGATPLSLAPGMLLGGAILLGLTALLGVDFSPNLSSTIAVGLMLVQMLLFAAVYALFFILQKLAGTVFLSQIGSVAAITGAAMAIGLLGEQGSLSLALAAMCIVSGVLLVAWRGAQENAQ
ncbi:EamA-like transporter family protein [Pseudomonas sp. URMO17WK12:I1]|uniref:DMT family transporter n=1 Tax=unclassified Pseudomonas TaxID=196821 RepID=UPI000484AD67|nr:MULTISPECIES: DMT family transporter [unclassified Pseudomonas]PZW64588.1 EamA-like transporter family protein [Pseudomonas sp. URMO17WK12:I1]